MPRILVLTTEPLPLPGLPATGAGLRAWGLAQGLRAAGLEVRLLMPEDAAATFSEMRNAECGMLTKMQSAIEIPPEGGTPEHFQSAIRNPQSAIEGGTPEHFQSAIRNPQSAIEWVGTFRRSELNKRVREENPDAIVLQHWGLARDLGEVEAPLAIDLAGPHLLERRLWGSPVPEADLGEKLDALRRADFLTASGERQRLYFLPYLAMAGWDLEMRNEMQSAIDKIPPEGGTPEQNQSAISNQQSAIEESAIRNPQSAILPVIPFSMRPAAEPAPVRSGRFVYGGYFLPWQDPSAAIEAALEAMDRAGRGELVFIGGAHPRVDVSRGRFAPLLEKLSRHPRVRMMEPMSFDRYEALLAEGGVALDLMAPNPERELAFTTRTVVYLAHGLPVIHDNYSELGEMIARAGAGWALDPADRAGLTALLDGLLSGAIDPAPRARGARELVARELDWEKTIGPLAEFCRAPAHRPGKTAARLSFEERDRRLRALQAAVEAAHAELATLRGKRWVRWGLALASSRAWLRWPAAVLAALAAPILLPIFLINDRLAKKGAGK